MTNLRTITLLGAAVALGACASAGQGQQHASTTLRAGSCAGLAADQQDAAAFFADGNLRRVEPLYLEDRASKAPSTRASIRNESRYLAGATLYVRAPQESSAFVERVMSCHAASSASESDHPNDPLRVNGIRAVDVREAGPHLRVSIAADDAASGRDILKRAEALRSGGSMVQVKQLAAAEGSSAF